jgi:transcription-repair coupling factor (superfamily II helicase)
MTLSDGHNNTLGNILSHYAEEMFLKLGSGTGRRINNIPVVLFAALLAYFRSGFLVVEDTAEHAAMLWHDIKYFSETCRAELRHVEYFPPPASPDLIGVRSRILHGLFTGNISGIITSSDALSVTLTPDMLDRTAIHLSSGLNIERSVLEASLIRSGYRKVSVVMEKGEYAERGWLFDIYPSTEELPVRVEFFGDEIDAVRAFDIETQRSVRDLSGLVIYPSAEPLSENPADGTGKAGTLLGMWRGDIFINDGAGIDEKDTGPAINPVMFSHFSAADTGIDSGALDMAGLGILPEERQPSDKLADRLDGLKVKTVVVLPVSAQIERIKDILSQGIFAVPVIPANDVCSYEGTFCITQGKLSSGLHLPGLLLLTGREIFGEQPAYRPIKRSRVSKLLLSMDDLKPGDYVVHRDHGIGRFIDLRRETIEGFEADIIAIEYAHGDRLQIPFQGIDKLGKYSGGEGSVPVIDRLGSPKWQNTKKKVRNSVKDMAEKLVRLYAEREVSRGLVFSEGTPMHAEFDEFFPYEETGDQIKAVESIKKHMQSDRPMDMLICGDVGYGKTEVAMKAAFRAVYDGKQVAVLVPTTLLAEQHYRTFRARFSAFPVRIDYLSRFKNSRDVRKTMLSIARGEIDIVIGTHMLLNKALDFQDLGLLIIDEEHRFGVAQKERLKELRKGVDVITLTATPIPRTLHMSLSGIREMETIETPPEERLAVRSAVVKYSDKTIREAIERELRREGQIFFVHNRIFDIEKTVSYLKKLVPAARIACAHGQASERELEKIMLSFLDRKTDLLVSTAIISSGLDIPTANTIIIDRADRFGLSDLYQLRGRVGRGNVQAYAYFLIPGEDDVTGDAKKRLQAIQEMSYLGAGFRLALKDLEIRGAGNLLGAEQSGHIYKVGFDMYMEMLEKAVAELKGGEIREETEPEIRLQLTALIPEHYIPDITLRLSIYKRLSALRGIKELNEFSAEMTDRFGRIPEEVVNLIHVIRIKIAAKQLFVAKVTGIHGRYQFTFRSPDAGYQLPEGFAEKLLEALSEVQVKMTGDVKLRFHQDGFELNGGRRPSGELIIIIEDILEELAARTKK